MLEKYQTLPFWQRLVVVIALLIIIGGVFYQYMYKPKQKEITQLTSEFNKLRVENTEARKMEKELPNLEMNLQRLQFKLDAIKEILPSEKEIETFLNQFYQTALKFNLKVLKYSKRPEASYEEFLIKVPMEVEARGQYQNLRRFFKELAGSTRIVNVYNLKLKIGKGNKIVAGFEITTFRFKMESE